ncbi:MAG: uncharacterized protein QG623_543 [Patescibacteria group bacterium]|nr:uncharacterized protein [Patescibacteria group bacterium]
MITLLVSSKTMLKKKVGFDLPYSNPFFESEARIVNTALSKLSQQELKKVMHVSDNLAKEVAQKIKDWPKAEKVQAWLLFSGDVYKGLAAETLTEEDFEWAQNKVWTLSGLYGIARPLDAISPYRLEAGYKLTVDGKKNIYDFWGDKIAKRLADEVVLNLSSEEYIKLIRKDFVGKIVTPLFLQDRKSGVKFEAVHAKVARGAMARWIIKNRIDDPDSLKNFELGGYVFDESRSSEHEPVFVRKAEGVMKIDK